MSALTDLFSAMANKIRSKTGTQTTYTPTEMVSDGIDDVYEAGVASATTPITPSNSSPAAMTANTGYSPTDDGYAIESYTPASPATWTTQSPMGYAEGSILKVINRSGVLINTYTNVDPSNSSPVSITEGWFYRAGNDGKVVSSVTNLTPDDSSPVTLSTNAIYKPTKAGKAVESITDVTPSSTPTSVSADDIVHIGGSGVIVDAIPTPTSITPDDGTPVQMSTGVSYSVSRTGYAIQNQPTTLTPNVFNPPSISNGTIYKGGGNGGYAIPSYTTVTPSDTPTSLTTTQFYYVDEPLLPPDTAYVIKRYSSLTPSNSSPAAITNGLMYRANGAGYAIESQPTSVTPSSTPTSVSSGDMLYMGGSGVIVDALPTPTSITPDNSSPVQMTTGNAYSVSRTGYAIQSYTDVQPLYNQDYDLAIGTIAKNAGSYPGTIIRPRGTITPSADGTAFSNSGWYKMTSSGYAYNTQPKRGNSGTVADTVGNAQTVTINTGLPSISKFALRCLGHNTNKYHAAIFWSSDDSSNYEGQCTYGEGTSSISGVYAKKALNNGVTVWTPIIVSVSGGTVTLKTGANASAAIKSGWWVAST